MRVDASGRSAERAVNTAFDHIATVQREMSFHDPQSELSQLNGSAHEAPQQIMPSLRRVLRAALALAHASEGRFDPTVGGRLVQWQQLPAPTNSEVDPAADWRDVRFLRDGRVQFRRPLWLDLGGIAKGYAVDRAVASLRRDGIAAGIVNAGGDLRVFGRMETVHVRDPARPGQSIPLLHARDAAVATSAGYFSEGQGHTALVDPLGGGSVGATCSVTVCARRAIWADALTKVVLLDPAASVILLRRLRASAVLIDRSGKRRHVA
jgi:thiamine biosynthesis lipoprotein